MVARNSLSQGAEISARISDELERLAGYAGDTVCQAILLRLLRSEGAGKDTSAWTLHETLGLPLPKVFAALRTLEYGKIINIVDNPSDPFGAFVLIRENGLDVLRSRMVAGNSV